MPLYKLKHLSCLALFALLCSCSQLASFSGKDTPGEPAVAEKHAPEQASRKQPQETVKTRPFESDTLFALLVAEIAANRHHPEITLAHYLDQAKKTGDPQLAERAARIADLLRLPTTLTQAALLWAELDRQNPEALRFAARGLIGQMQFEQAFDLSLSLLEQGQSGVFVLIANQASQFSQDDERTALLSRFETARQQYGNNPELMMGTAVLLNRASHTDEAINLARKASRISDSSDSDILLARLLNHAGESAQARSVLEKRLARDPGSAQTRHEYARLLTETDLQAAKRQFEILLEQQPENPEIVLALALISQDIGDTEDMLYYFYRLVYAGVFLDTAHLNLGLHAMQSGDVSSAIEHFKRVEQGQEYFSALQYQIEILLHQQQETLANALVKRHLERYPEREALILLAHANALQMQDRYAESLRLLTDALAKYPENPDYLYTRSLAYEKTGQVIEAEQDLRKLLATSAENPMVLNALGYMLMVHTTRIEEAESLLEKALELDPDDPATMDSYGWLLYRKGERKLALDWLKKAFLLYPNHEVAAHLGEVLWISGFREEANTIWELGLEDKPDSPLILETRQRLESAE